MNVIYAWTLNNQIVLTVFFGLQTLKAEKSGTYVENPETSGLTGSDLVDPFAPSQFHEILGTATENAGVFSGQVRFCKLMLLVHPV